MQSEASWLEMISPLMDAARFKSEDRLWNFRQMTDNKNAQF